MAGFAITDDGICREAAKQEVVRRYFRYKKELLLGIERPETMERIERIMEKLNLKPEDRKVVSVARYAEEDAEKYGKGNKGVYCGAAIELHDGRIATGKNSALLHAESAAVINAIKMLAGIDENEELIPIEILQNVNMLKRDILKGSSESLNLEETLVALAVSAKHKASTQKCLQMLSYLNNCDMHVTYLPSGGDEAGLVKLRMNVTTDGKLTSKSFTRKTSL